MWGSSHESALIFGAGHRVPSPTTTEEAGFLSVRNRAKIVAETLPYRVRTEV